MKLRRSKKVRCPSGLVGYRCRLRDNYENLQEFEYYCGIYGLEIRLGYDRAEDAWDDNPWVMGSVNPSDFCRVNPRTGQPAKMKA